MESTVSNALQLFKDEVSSEEMSVRINAVRRLPVIAVSLQNNAAAKDQLIAFVETVITNSDDDEVLFGMAEGLAPLTSIYKAQQLLPVLEKLLSVEETIVREKTVETFTIMVGKLDRQEISSLIVPSVVKMAVSQSFSVKMSALSIMTEIFPILTTEEKTIFIDKINTLFTEESLILRRNLANKIGKICKYISKESLQSDIFNHFKNLTNDDSDSVRIITIESLVELARVFTNEENKTHVIPLIIQMTGDKSWRVKLHLAKYFADLAEAVGSDIAESSLISIFSTLLRDPENEVRIASVKSLKKFVLLLSLEKVQAILAYLQTLAKDPVSLVRTGVCEVLNNVLRMNLEPLGKDVVKSRIQPIITDLINNNDLEVRIEALKLLPLWSKWVNTYVMDLIASNALVVNLDNPSWRFRYAVLESLIDMACEFQNQKVFDKSMKKFVLKGFADRAFKVRKLIVLSIKRLTPFLDETYVVDNLYKEFAKVCNEQTEFYTYRISGVYAMEAVVFALANKEKAKDLFWKNVSRLRDDPITNLRQVAVKVLIRVFDANVYRDLSEQISKLLENMQGVETDPEIRAIVAEKVGK